MPNEDAERSTGSREMGLSEINDMLTKCVDTLGYKELARLLGNDPKAVSLWGRYPVHLLPDPQDLHALVELLEKHYPDHNVTEELMKLLHRRLTPVAREKVGYSTLGGYMISARSQKAMLALSELPWRKQLDILEKIAEIIIEERRR